LGFFGTIRFQTNTPIAKVGSRFLSHGPVDINYGHARAFSSQASSYAFAYPACRTGNNGHFVM
jgi:hypothetical protein